MMVERRPNFVFIMTDTQNKAMVGCYGDPRMDTPNLDRLAGGGVRFDRAYTAQPVCTPARGAIFSGLHPQINGAYANAISPHADIPLMGTVFKALGYRAAYTGKWHLDGSRTRNYYGSGRPDGGFEPDWWYDGRRYLDDLGARAKHYTMFPDYDADDLRRMGFGESDMWGHRVADRAVDFLSKVGDDPFVLAVSFDEPHQPYFAPPEYWEKYSLDDLLAMKPSVQDSLEGKPELQRVHRAQTDRGIFKFLQYGDLSKYALFYGCNSWIDREIGRVLDAVDRLHADDTIVIYTSDHGDMLGSHGLYSKGPMMYEEIVNIPFIVRAPGGQRGAVNTQAVSHLDIMATMLDYAGAWDRVRECYDGRSLRPALCSGAKIERDYVMVNFNRYEIFHESFGEFYPIRCATDGRYKLVINLFDTDEFYDLADDPEEVHNRIDDPSCAAKRNDMHEWICAEMKRMNDPFRTFRWGDRPWHSIRKQFYWIADGERNADRLLPTGHFCKNSESRIS